MTDAHRPGAREADLAITFLVRAWKLDREAKGLRMPAGSAAHMRANVWRHAAVLAEPMLAEAMMRGAG